MPKARNHIDTLLLHDLRGAFDVLFKPSTYADRALLKQPSTHGSRIFSVFRTKQLEQRPELNLRLQAKTDGKLAIYQNAPSDISEKVLLTLWHSLPD